MTAPLPAADSGYLADLEIPFKQTIEDTPVAVSLLVDGRWVFANRAAEELLGLKPGEAVGRRPRDFADGASTIEVDRWLTSPSAPPSRAFQTRMVRANGAVVHVESRAHRVRLGDRDGIAVMSFDVTERTEREAELAHAATHDALTGLVNRALLLDRLEQAVARIGRGSAGLVVMFLDLDGFKDINDTHGHPVGDHVLREVAQRLRLALRSTDTIARLAGDEFVVAADVTGPEPPDGQVRMLRARVERALDAPVHVAAGALYVGASIGSLLVTDTWEPIRVIAEADRLMYQHKQKRRRHRHTPGAHGPPEAW